MSGIDAVKKRDLAHCGLMGQAPTAVEFRNMAFCSPCRELISCQSHPLFTVFLISFLIFSAFIPLDLSDCYPISASSVPKDFSDLLERPLLKF
jgi:hypothetical protein